MPKKNIKTKKSLKKNLPKKISKSGVGKKSSIKKKKVVSKSKKTLKKSKPVLKPKKLLKKSKPVFELKKHPENPIIRPKKENEWESYQTFNPAAIFENGRVHILYRALGSDGVSRLGYASSADGIHFDERLNEPVFVHYTKPLDVSLQKPKDFFAYASGGSWAGCEDPRITRIDDRVYMLFVAFDGWNIPRLAITSIKLEDFLNKKWKWAGSKIISPEGIIDKSGVVFPEKINGKYVIMHRIFPNIQIDYLDNLDFNDGKHLEEKDIIKIRKNKWDSRKIGAGAPPIKTKYGWLLIYYGVDDKRASQYKIGAMLLDLKNPAKVLKRTDKPILEPVEWYENEGHKSGIAYPCGAVVIKDNLFVFYGGADTVVCVATAKLDDFMKELISDKEPKLEKISETPKK